MLRGPGRPEDQQCFMLPIRPPTYISTYFPLQLHVIIYHALLYPQVGELETLQRHKASVILAPPISFVTWEMIDLHHHLHNFLARADKEEEKSLSLLCRHISGWV